MPRSVFLASRSRQELQTRLRASNKTFHLLRPRCGITLNSDACHCRDWSKEYFS